MVLVRIKAGGRWKRRSKREKSRSENSQLTVTSQAFAPSLGIRQLPFQLRNCRLNLRNEPQWEAVSAAFLHPSLSSLCISCFLDTTLSLLNNGKRQRTGLHPPCTLADAIQSLTGRQSSNKSVSATRTRLAQVDPKSQSKVNEAAKSIILLDLQTIVRESRRIIVLHQR